MIHSDRVMTKADMLAFLSDDAIPDDTPILFAGDEDDDFEIRSAHYESATSWIILGHRGTVHEQGSF